MTPTLDTREFHARHGVCLCVAQDADECIVYAVVMTIAG